MLRDQFVELIERLQNSSYPEMIQDVYDFIDSCGKYIDKVVAMEAVIITQDTRLQKGKYIEVEKERRQYQNGLIASINIINRICKMVEMQPIFKGDLNSRIEIAEFAMAVVNEMFETRKL